LALQLGDLRQRAERENQRSRTEDKCELAANRFAALPSMFASTSKETQGPPPRFRLQTWVETS
jgi:hypothetical protein